MADLRQQVLDLIQSGFPIESDPYGHIAGTLGVSRDSVLEAVAGLRRDGSIRRMGASFASKRLGYRSTLCALAVPGSPDKVDSAAAIVNEYPNVTHNYLRDNRYNLWFTIIARSADEVARILSQIQERTGCADSLNLPATALYKIRVDFSQKAPAKEKPVLREGARPFDAECAFDRMLVRWAQHDIAGSGELPDAEPFATAALWINERLDDAPVSEQEVLERLRDWKASGVIRRFGALVAHRKMGFAFNGMTVWDVPEERLDDLGRAFAEFPFVSHCYARPRSEAWPYSLYGMVHAKTLDELNERVDKMRAIAGIEPEVLVSSKEYKKSSMAYFEE